MRLSVIVLAIICIAAVPATQPSTVTVVLTQDPLGFKQGEHSYTIGMSSDDFQKQFGAPENSEDSGVGITARSYASKGIGVAVDNKTKNIVDFDFHTLDEKGGPPWAAPAKAGIFSTDKGITSASTYEDVVQAYGKPTKENKTSGTADYPATLFVQYDTNQTGVLFLFIDGKLDHISVMTLRH